MLHLSTSGADAPGHEKEGQKVHSNSGEGCGNVNKTNHRMPQCSELRRVVNITLNSNIDLFFVLGSDYARKW
jgi:hypothetical protein